MQGTPCYHFRPSFPTSQAFHEPFDPSSQLLFPLRLYNVASYFSPPPCVLMCVSIQPWPVTNWADGCQGRCDACLPHIIPLTSGILLWIISRARTHVHTGQRTGIGKRNVHKGLRGKRAPHDNPGPIHPQVFSGTLKYPHEHAHPALTLPPCRRVSMSPSSQH